MSLVAWLFSYGFLTTLATPVAELGVEPGTAGAAHTLAPGRFEVGLYQPLRWGITDGVELQTHPLLDALMPGAAVKVRWSEAGDWTVATRHSLGSPTPLLRLLRREGALGLYPLDAEIPVLLTSAHHVLATGTPAAGQHVTLRGGFRIAPHFGTLDMPKLDLPVASARTAAWHEPVVLDAGVAWDGCLPGPFAARLSGEVYVIPGIAEDVVFEQAGALTWRATEGFSVHAGWRWVWARYPWGIQEHVLPVIDAQWAFSL